jgi:hypothetical protein
MVNSSTFSLVIAIHGLITLTLPSPIGMGEG